MPDPSRFTIIRASQNTCNNSKILANELHRYWLPTLKAKFHEHGQVLNDHEFLIASGGPVHHNQ